MKKASSAKKDPKKKKAAKSDVGELRKPSKLKPLKEKDKKNWKSSLEEEDDEFNELPSGDDDLKLDDFGTDLGDDDDEFFDDSF